MIALPGYSAIVDKDEADKARANLRERNIDEDSVEVVEDRVLVIGYRPENDVYLVVHRDGSSSMVGRDRLTFDVKNGPTWLNLNREFVPTG